MKKYSRLVTFIAIFAASFVVFTGTSHALSGSSFKPGRIIDDAIFTNKSSMSTVQIQQFLESKVAGGSCDTSGSRPSTRWYNAAGRYYTHAEWGALSGNPAPYVCLTNYRENPTTKQTNLGNPDVVIAGAQTAAEIIYNASQQYNINPQVLLVLLQKEQSLLTDDWPWASQYSSATGAYCPDTAPCDAAQAGFGTQVREAARLFRYYMNTPFLYFVGNNYVLYNPNRDCGGTNVYIENLATEALYHYTPYQPNAAALNNLYGTGDACSAYGNRNFWRMFNDWFGSTQMPYAFKTATGPIYLYISGYKIEVSAMGLLQDYGISPESIQTVDQGTVDSVPTPTLAENISTGLSYLIKSPSDSDADGGSIYLVSVGKRYQIASMQQLSDFGYSVSSISYIPLGYINSLPSAGYLTNFIQAPNSSVFKVEGGKKRIIFEYGTYLSLNPSNQYSAFSYYAVNQIESDKPLLDRPALIKRQGSETVNLFLNGNYYAVPTYEIFSCWGLDTTLRLPTYRVAENGYIGPIVTNSPLACLNNNGVSTYILSRNLKYSIPAIMGVTQPTQLNTDLSGLINSIPSAPLPLKQYIKSNTSSAVWYIENGVRKVVPTYSNFVLLNIPYAQIDIIDHSAVSSILQSGIKLGTGQLVKTDSSAAVYAVSNSSKIQYLTSSEFLGFGNSWSDIETYSAAVLDQAYPTQQSAINKYFVDSATNKTYLVDSSACYLMSDAQLLDYGQNINSLLLAQTYSSSTFPKFNLSSCRPASVFIKQPGQFTVYWVSAGTKRLISRWDTLVAKSGTSNPYVITLEPHILSSIPTGTPLD